MASQGRSNCAGVQHPGLEQAGSVRKPAPRPALWPLTRVQGPAGDGTQRTGEAQRAGGGLRVKVVRPSTGAQCVHRPVSDMEK